MFDKGLVQVYTGDGKGKTTAAIGLAIRVAGWGGKVYITQFLKPETMQSGEVMLIRKYIQNITVVRFPIEYGFQLPDKNTSEYVELEQAANSLLKYAEIAIMSTKYHMVILDEVNMAMSLELVSIDKVVNIIKKKPENVELVLTGRYAPEKIINIADMVTEVKEVKHPYSTMGIKARQGIEW
jgi:cob(I)alamin adenosyltransferase